jgi:hypothetical protein
MTTHQQHDMYYENPSSRSPGSHRHQPQTLHRQSSRQFDAYSGLPTNALYTAEDHAAQQSFVPRYDERMQSQTLNPGFPNFMNNPWNSYGPGPNNNLAALGATTRVKPVAGRGRAGLPTVCPIFPKMSHFELER